MFAIGVPELLIGLLIVVGGGIVLARRVGRRRVAVAQLPQPTRETVLIGITRVVGILVGVLAAATVSSVGPLGVGSTLAPAAFGLALLLATVIGEVLVRQRRPEGFRTASLAPRRVRDYLPAGTTTAVAMVTGLLVLTMTVTTATASVDAATGHTRSLACHTGEHASAQTPYPGAYYTVPLALMLLLVLVTAGLAARETVLRPRGRAGTEGYDDALRRRSLDVIVGATGIAVCASFIGVGTTAAFAMNSLSSEPNGCGQAWMGPVAATLLLGVIASLMIGFACWVRLLLGSPGQFVDVSRSRRAAAA